MGDPVMCCLLGICCPPAKQQAAWVELFVSQLTFSEKHAEAMTDATLQLSATELKAFAESLTKAA